jgi:chromosome partitioning protein
VFGRRKRREEKAAAARAASDTSRPETPAPGAQPTGGRQPGAAIDHPPSAGSTVATTQATSGAPAWAPRDTVTGGAGPQWPATAGSTHGEQLSGSVVVDDGSETHTGADGDPVRERATTAPQATGGVPVWIAGATADAATATAADIDDAAHAGVEVATGTEARVAAPTRSGVVVGAVLSATTHVSTNADPGADADLSDVTAPAADTSLGADAELGAGVHRGPDTDHDASTDDGGGTAADVGGAEPAAHDGVVSRGTPAVPPVMEEPSVPTVPDAAATSGEDRPRRGARPRPVSVTQLGAVYAWETEQPADAAPGGSTDIAADRAGALDTSDDLVENTGATASGQAEEHPAGPRALDQVRATLADTALTSTNTARTAREDERGPVDDQQDPAPGTENAHGVPSSAGDPEEARRAAIVDSLPRASDDTPLLAELQLDARRRIELRGRKFPRPPRTRVMTVANQKGGVGKTTTTVNLAAALAQAGLQVLVLDNDPQGNASTALGIEHRAGTPSIYEVLVDGAPMHEAVQQSPDVPGLWCLPATIDLSGAEIELVSMVARETRLRTALDNYLTWRTDNGLERIDYVFVDCPPSLGLLTVNAFVVAREVLIPIQCEYYALEGLSQLLKTIDLIQAHLNPRLAVSTILLTMYDARTNLAQQVAEEVRTHFPEQTLRTTVPRSVRISEAPSYGQTVITYDGSSSGALAYLEAARELAERAVQATTSTDGVPVAATPDQEDQ